MSSSFTDAHREAVEKQLEAGGGQMWSRAVVLFSHGDWLGDTSIERRIESEGEPLQMLVEKCGNRYHVLDNKHRGGGAQVNELIKLIEEMLVEETALHRGDHMWKSVSSAREQQLDARKKDLKALMRCRHQLSRDLSESANSPAQMSLNCPGGADDGGQIVALPAGRRGGRTGITILNRDGFVSCLASMLSKERLRLPKRLLVSPQTRSCMLVEENAVSVSSLCHPALRERTLRRLTESGRLQELIDQWDDSSLEELEAFIDSYFEMVWEQTMGSFQPTEPDRPTAEWDAVVEKAGQEEVLSSIDRKLSKLELLEEIRRDMAELRMSLERSWKAIQEIREINKQDENNTSELEQPVRERYSAVCLLCDGEGC
ncbi:hypothetical protein L3Q82_002668 [Scortum barcoo]|uniref:Uncharacterized protein n=1 Tax=Scortum barcoo TaxID=214431 RepID=A0ACB8VUE7_9TELE|nr:hypothetical protein L3Q82_002668 [Scortum barcoo]